MTQTTRIDKISWRSTPVPAARAIENFSAAEVGGDEYVFLDNERLEYHTLNKSAFAVWQLCDGNRTSTDISRALGRTETHLPFEAVDLAVAEVGEAGLLESPSVSWNARLNRRRVVKLASAGVLGAVVIPAVSSITVPHAASAESVGQCASPSFPANNSSNCNAQCGPSVGGVCTDVDPTASGCCCTCN